MMVCEPPMAMNRRVECSIEKGKKGSVWKLIEQVPQAWRLYRITGEKKKAKAMD